MYIKSQYVVPKLCRLFTKPKVQSKWLWRQIDVYVWCSREIKMLELQRINTNSKFRLEKVARAATIMKVYKTSRSACYIKRQVQKFSTLLESDSSMERLLLLICNRYLDTPSSYLSKFSWVDIKILRSLLYYLQSPLLTIINPVVKGFWNMKLDESL